MKFVSKSWNTCNGFTKYKSFGTPRQRTTLKMVDGFCMIRKYYVFKMRYIPFLNIIQWCSCGHWWVKYPDFCNCQSTVSLRLQWVSVHVALDVGGASEKAMSGTYDLSALTPAGVLDRKQWPGEELCWCLAKTAVSPLHQQWRYCSLVLRHWNEASEDQPLISQLIESTFV